MTTDRCLCSHGEDLHFDSGKGQCRRVLCGCKYFRPSPSAGDEAESWLAAREGSGDISATGGDAA